MHHFAKSLLLWLPCGALLRECTLRTDRLLLQRVGGRYRFIHRLVQEHFAAMSLEQGE